MKIARGELLHTEVAARAAGGAVAKVIEECCGTALDQTNLLLHMKHSAPLQKRDGAKMACCEALSLHPPKARVIKGAVKSELDSTLSVVSWRVIPGQRLNAPTNMRDITLSLVITNPDLESLTRDFDRIIHEDYLNMERKPMLRKDVERILFEVKGLNIKAQAIPPDSSRCKGQDTAKSYF